MSEKSGDFRFRHFAGVPFIMKENKASNPIDVSLFGANAEMLCAESRHALDRAISVCLPFVLAIELRSWIPFFPAFSIKASGLGRIFPPLIAE